MLAPASFPARLVAVEAWLQAGGHAVGALVALPDPPRALAVLDADGCDACGTRRGLSTHCDPPREHPGVPPPTCHDPPEPLHQPDGRSHGAPGFHPLVHQEDAQTWGGAEAASERPVPCAGSPPRGGSAPWAHPARRCRCGPPSPSPGLSSRCRAPTASPRRGARLYGWPGSPCATRWPRRHLGVATVLSAPRGDKVWGPRARPHPPSPRMKPMASMPATRSMGSPWKGCSRSATQSCKAWGDSGGAGCP